MADHLQSALQPLKEHSLPNKYLEETVSVDKEAASRYKAARSKYLHQRVEELMMQQVATFDGKTFDMPTCDAPDGFENELIAGVKDKAKEIR